MKKTAPEYTPVDLSRWPRKEHFEVFQSFAECTINQTVLIDITALRKHIKAVGWKFYPTIIFLLSNIMNRHPEFRMAMKDNELVIWNEIHPSYTIFHPETETFSSLWSHYDGNIHHFQNTYAEDTARYGNSLSYWPKEESRENVFCLVYSVGNVYELYDEHCAHEELLFAYVHVWKILRAGWKIAAAYGGAGASFGVRWLPCGKDV